MVAVWRTLGVMQGDDIAKINTTLANLWIGRMHSVGVLHQAHRSHHMHAVRFNERRAKLRRGTESPLGNALGQLASARGLVQLVKRTVSPESEALDMLSITGRRG